MVVASEMKALFEYCSTFELFPPGQETARQLPLWTTPRTWRRSPALRRTLCHPTQPRSFAVLAGGGDCPQASIPPPPRMLHSLTLRCIALAQLCVLRHSPSGCALSDRPVQVFSGSLPARASDGFKHWCERRHTRCGCGCGCGCGGSQRCHIANGLAGTRRRGTTRAPCRRASSTTPSCATAS